jgi:hypothetical protein
VPVALTVWLVEGVAVDVPPLVVFCQYIMPGLPPLATSTVESPQISPLPVTVTADGVMLFTATVAVFVQPVAVTVPVTV